MTKLTLTIHGLPDELAEDAADNALSAALSSLVTAGVIRSMDDVASSLDIEDRLRRDRSAR